MYLSCKFSSKLGISLYKDVYSLLKLPCFFSSSSYFFFLTKNIFFSPFSVRTEICLSCYRSLFAMEWEIVIPAYSHSVVHQAFTRVMPMLTILTPDHFHKVSFAFKNLATAFYFGEGFALFNPLSANGIIYAISAHFHSASPSVLAPNKVNFNSSSVFMLD